MKEINYIWGNDVNYLYLDKELTRIKYLPVLNNIDIVSNPILVDIKEKINIYDIDLIHVDLYYPDGKSFSGYIPCGLNPVKLNYSNSIFDGRFNIDKKQKKLYLVERTDEVDCREFKNIISCRYNENDARTNIDGNDIFEWKGYIDLNNVFLGSLKVTYLGLADESIPIGIVHTSIF